MLRIKGVLWEVKSRPRDAVVRAFGANAHLRRGLTDPALWEHMVKHSGTTEE